MRFQFVGIFAILAALTACGPADKECTPSDCPSGCCGPHGQCQPGTEIDACGNSGNTCEACGSGSRCSAGVCRQSYNGAGGSAAGGSSSSGGTISKGGNSSAKGGNTATGGAMGSGGSTGAGGAQTKIGYISVGQTRTIAAGQTYDSSYMSTTFSEVQPGNGGPTCQMSQHGTCWAFDCPLGGTMTTPTPRYAAAGRVSVTGGLYTAYVDTMAGSYSSVSTQKRLWESGMTLSVSSTGGEVPAFANQKVTVSTQIFNVLSPASGALSVSRAQPLNFTWAGASGKDVVASVATVSSTHSVSIACTFSSTAGAGSVPASAMALLMPTSSTVKGYVSLSNPLKTEFWAGSWFITFSVGTGSPYSWTFSAN